MEPTKAHLAEHLQWAFAFVGDTERYAESVCAMHLSLGGPPTDASELDILARATPKVGIDWVSEGERCGMPVDDDPTDEAWFELVTKRLDATIAKANAKDHVAMARCLAMAPQNSSARV